MFDFDVGKLLVFGIVALAVIPPKDLPRVMRTVGQYVGRMRRMASEFQGQFMEAMKEADLDSVKREIEAVNKAAKIDSSFDPVMAMRTEMSHAIEPPKAVASADVALAAPEPSAAEATSPLSPAAEASRDASAAAEPPLPEPALEPVPAPEPFNSEIVAMPLKATEAEPAGAVETQAETSHASSAAP